MAGESTAVAYPHVYHDGQWTDPSRATVRVGSLALRYGLSVFEGIRLYAQVDGSGVRPFLLDRHVSRMADSLTLMRLADPGISKVPELIEALVLRNGIDED